jgi:hypothetical protein
MMKRIRPAIIALLILFTCSYIMAEEGKGIVRVEAVQGAVEVRQPGKEWAAAKAGMILAQADIIRSKKDSWVLLNVYRDKSKIASVELKKNSELRIMMVKPDKEILFDLALGEAMVKSENLNKGKAKFEVKTPTSFLEVVGKATFSVSVEKLD